MRNPLRKCLLVLLVAGVSLLTSYGIREYPHWQHYRRLEQEGKWKASVTVCDDPVFLTPQSATCTVEVHNTGTQTWHNFCLGIRERLFNSSLGPSRVSRIRIVDDLGTPYVLGGDRLPLGPAVPPNRTLRLSVHLRLPADDVNDRLFFQVVDDAWDGVGWFGKETRLHIAHTGSRP